MTPYDADIWTKPDRAILKLLRARLDHDPRELIAFGFLIAWEFSATIEEPVAPVPSDDGTDLDDLHADRIWAADLKAWWPIIPAPKGLDA